MLTQETLPGKTDRRYLKSCIDMIQNRIETMEKAAGYNRLYDMITPPMCHLHFINFLLCELWLGLKELDYVEAYLIKEIMEA